MVDSIYADQGRVDDPHLWERARRSGSTWSASSATAARRALAERVRRDFEGGIRAGVAGTRRRSSPDGDARVAELRARTRPARGFGLCNIAATRTRSSERLGRHPGGRRERLDEHV